MIFLQAVLQRVHEADCLVGGESVGRIEQGMVTFLSIEESDTRTILRDSAKRLPDLRLFENEAGDLDRSIRTVGGGILIVPNFTVCGDLSKGLRPSFHRAASPDRAKDHYEFFVEVLSDEYSPVRSGQFGSMMEVTVTNDGPVTLVLKSR